MSDKLDNLKPNLESDKRPTFLDFSGSTCATFADFLINISETLKKKNIRKCAKKYFSSKAKIKLSQPFFYIELWIWHLEELGNIDLIKYATPW